MLSVIQGKKNKIKGSTESTDTFGFLLPSQAELLLSQSGGEGDGVKSSIVTVQALLRLGTVESVFSESQITAMLFFNRLHAVGLSWQVLSHVCCSWMNQDDLSKITHGDLEKE